MKSSREDLKKRGFVEEAEMEPYRHQTAQDALPMLQSAKAFERTIAVRLINQSRDLSVEEQAEILVSALAREKSLYTKIEICNVLETGGLETAKKMIQYLGRIGNNQHRSMPQEVSKKTSYPLPRDIIARTLGRMDPCVLPAMLEALENMDTSKVSEVIDAIGYMCFYHTFEDPQPIIDKLFQCLDTFGQEEVIRWKIAMALSAFRNEEAVKKLEELHRNDPEVLVRKEACRSLKYSMDCEGLGW